MSNCPYTKPNSTAGASIHYREGGWVCRECLKEARNYRTGRDPGKMRRRLKAIETEVAELTEEYEKWTQKLKEGK